MKKREYKFYGTACTLFSVGFLSSCFCYGQNNSIDITELEYKSHTLPGAFDGFRIVQISDLHNKSFGKEQSVLSEKVRRLEPDIIVVTGDLIDKRHPNLDKAMDFIEKAVNFSTVLFVPGNHEQWFRSYPLLSRMLQEAGVIVLNDSKAVLKRNGERITVTGKKDISFLKPYYLKEDLPVKFFQSLKALYRESDTEFNILLCHRPERFVMYERAGFDLVFCGHAHGGQIRLPLIGGLFAPNQGFFPKYSEGMHQKENTTMVVSRGLGKSVMPLRIFNHPEIVCVTLKKV